MYKLQLSIVIPCLNEKGTIQRVILDAKKNARKFFLNNYEIIVCDNGSTDGSLDILKTVKGIKVVNVPVRGYGAALHWGIMKASSKNVLYADADLSYPFSNLGSFKRIINTDYDLVLGSRLIGKIENNAMPFLHRYLGTPMLTYLIKFLYHIPTTDCNSGMRMVKKSFYKKLNMKCSGMEWASELLLKTALHNGSYFEVPITFLKDKRIKNPHLNTWSDGWRHLKSIVLLKPELFIYTMIIFLLSAFFSYPLSFSFTSLFILLFVTTFFSYLALIFLSYAINGLQNKISRILNKNIFVSLTAVLIALEFLLIYLLPESHLGSKILLAGIISIEIIWVFMIETIKTHLVNRLP